MKYGLSESTIGKIQHVLAQFPAVEKAIVYGSRAKGNFKPGSDIDLTLCGTALTSALCANVAEALDDLLLPYTIDLSVFETLDHASLREHIERVGVVFYQRAPDSSSQPGNAALRSGSSVHPPRQSGDWRSRGEATGVKGWRTKTLGDTCEMYQPKTISGKELVENGAYSVFGANGVIGRYDKYNHEEPQLLITCRGATCGSVNISAPKSWITGNAMVVRPKNGEIDVRFLEYLFRGGLDISKAITGAAQPQITRTNLEPLTISYPVALAEQQQIVGILDEAFDGIATAKANAEKNLHNARALFESHLESVFTQRGEGWTDRMLDQVCIVERGSSPRPIKEYFTTESNGVNWIKIGDTEEGGKYVYSTGQKITPEGALHSRFVKEGDFILTNSMSYGRPYIMKTSGYIHDGWFVLRLNIAINTDYFYYLLSSPVVQRQFASLASGSVVKNISGDLVKKAILPIPPLKHQQVIVEKLLVMSEETQRLASIYERKLAALDALKKSLLHQAFTGQLTGSAP